MKLSRRALGPKQRGALMLALMAGIAIAMILTSVAVQSWTDVTKRDNEAEMIFRAQDLVRALKRFQAEKGKLPVELKELMEPGQRGQYFLRRLWKDPLVKGGKWQFVYASPAGGLFDPTVPVAPTAADGEQPLSSSPSLLNPTAPGAVPGIPIGPDGTPDGTGLPIAGVKTRCKDQPFRFYRDKTVYSDWVFSIFDVVPGQPGQPAQPGKAPQQGQAPQPEQGGVPGGLKPDSN